MSTSPQPEFKSEQYEFNAEQNRTISDLAAAMDVVAMLMKVLGTVFLIFFGLLLLKTVNAGTGFGPVIGLGSGMLLCLSIGFWTSSSAGSFKRIVETKNRDIWHLMNALGSLHNMYSLLRTIIIASLVLLIIGFGIFAYDNYLTRG